MEESNKRKQPWYLKYLLIIGAFLAGATVAPLLEEVVVYKFNSAVSQPDYSIAADACSTLVTGERKIVGAKSGREIDTNMKFPSQAYVTFKNDGIKAITEASFIVTLNGPDDGTGIEPELLLMDISGSTFGALSDLRNPVISNSGKMISFDHAVLNPDEQILIEISVLGPVKIYTEARKTGITHSHTTHPGCTESSELSQALKNTDWVVGTSNYVNPKYCKKPEDPKSSSGIECTFKFESDTFSFPKDFDFGAPMQGTLDLRYDKDPSH